MAIQRQTCLDLIAELSTVVRQGRNLGRHLVDLVGPAKPGCPSVNSYGVLLILERTGGSRVTDLAAEVNVDASVLSRQAAALERGGFVARDPDPLDRRAARLRITATGRRALRDWQSLRAEWLRQALSGWAEADAQALVTLLGRLWGDVASAAVRDESPGAPEPHRPEPHRPESHRSEPHKSKPVHAPAPARTGAR